MRLSEIASAYRGANVIFHGETKREDIEITGLCTDSRLARRGDLFFCFTGGKVDSHLFAADALDRGAAALVVERELPISLPQILVGDVRAAMGLFAAKFYGLPNEKLKIVGITGTNGKTSVSKMLAAILERAGKKVAVVGTLGIFYGKKQIAPELTTPDPVFLHGVFADMVKEGVEYVVMEVSAHALYYKKDEGICYAACIFTNCTRDHLDFFLHMKHYKQAKMRLFSAEKCPIAVLNGDDETGREIGFSRTEKRLHGKVETCYYALESPADVFAVITDESIGGTEFMLNMSDELCRISLSLPGRHNVYNALAAATCARALGIPTAAIAGGLKSLKRISGRLERIDTKKGCIFVDYAHTPDGLEKVLSALRLHCKGRLVCLFGCGGNRDREKRPMMGAVAAKCADFSVLTSDNPRFEEPEAIISAIESGFRRYSTSYVVIPDRKRAIAYAVSLLKKGDVLLVAGKGGEEYQEIMGIKYEYNDNAVIMEALSSIGPSE